MSKELKLEDKTMIISETDTKGNILYANSDFCTLAGYTKDELIGNSHNLIRHQDMPKETFKDLWKTIRSGKVWKGIVKNITKDGDFYWVNTTAYKVIKSNGEERYISVRVKPTTSQIQIAADLYRDMR